MALEDDHVPKLAPMSLANDSWSYRKGPTLYKHPWTWALKDGWLLINCKSIFDREPSKAQRQLLDFNYSTKLYLRI